MLEALREVLEFDIGLSSRLGNFSFSANSAFDPYRNQYDATRLWRQVLSAREGSLHKLLVVTDYDLFIPVLTFVFGEAHLGGRAGIVSACRLHESFYGLPPNDDLLFSRLLKETIHEIGHLYGLSHCYTPGCVMGPSTLIEGVDLKSEKFCLECLQAFAREREGLLARLQGR
jgi:archaemetzincin